MIFKSKTADGHSSHDKQDVIEGKKSTKKTKLQSIPEYLNRSSSHIWKSKLSWRIATVVFLTILAVQAVVLTLTIKQEEARILNEIKEIGRSAIAPTIDGKTTFLKTPISPDRANRLISSTIVNGLSIYSANYLLLGNYGEPVSISMVDRDSLAKTYRSSDGSSYEVVFRPDELRRPYIVAARLNSERLNRIVENYIFQTVLIMFLLSGFVTVVLMIALGHWLLEPILFMRGNLVAAQQNPENPKIEKNPFSVEDEIGGAIEIAQILIKQNSDNMQQIRSAAEDKIHKLAYFDQLTGLPNRISFLQKLTEQAFTGEDGKSKKLAVVTLDIDQF